MESELTTIQKVILLQEADVFEYTSMEDLTKIAQVSEETFYSNGKKIFDEGDLSDAMYIVISGSVKINRNRQEIATIDRNKSFGAWALFDDEVRVISAETTEDSYLLKIEKEDLFDVLSDNLQITEGILKKFSKRLRTLMSQVPKSGAS